jgi:peptidoglycan/LPS O-acetylase OafA/YrhL
MGFYSVWSYFASMAAIFLFATIPFLKWADAPPSHVPSRVQSVDGLRGILALGVFFQHAAIYHQYLITRQWSFPPTRFYTNLGQISVAFFFMITGYLFWAQVLKAGGRLDLLRLYVGRAFRICPLYFFLALIIIMGVGVETGWKLRESALGLTSEIAKLLAGGFFTDVTINRFAETGLISAYVTWTLHYEWLFYFSLALLTLFARIKFLGYFLPVLLVFAVVILFAVHSDHRLPFALLFLMGMTVASGKMAGIGKLVRVPDWALSIVVIGCVAFALTAVDGAYSVIPILILGFSFGLIVECGTLFGLLLTLPAKRLGDVSYGIYLLQGPVLFLAFGLPFSRSFATNSAGAHWVVVMGAAVALIVLATLTHVLIERPGIRAGKWVWTKISAIG